jgi:hypothetical protein
MIVHPIERSLYGLRYSFMLLSAAHEWRFADANFNYTQSARRFSFMSLCVATATCFDMYRGWGESKIFRTGAAIYTAVVVARSAGIW